MLTRFLFFLLLLLLHAYKQLPAWLILKDLAKIPELKRNAKTVFDSWLENKGSTNWGVTYNELPSAYTKIEGCYYVPAEGKHPVFSPVWRSCGDQRVCVCAYVCMWLWVWSHAPIRRSRLGYENLVRRPLGRLLRHEFHKYGWYIIQIVHDIVIII